MPKIPIVKSRELIRVLKKLGFEEFHQVGSHKQFKHSDGRRITVPVHPSQDIRRGTMKGIIDDVGISVEEFKKYLKK